MKRHLGVVPGIDKTFMLVTPYHKIDEVWKEVLGQIASLCVCMTGVMSAFGEISKALSTY